jgi:UDP-N-acetylglucosamine acyltransferase
MIHPTAIVDSAARVGADVDIGPYCVVGPDIVLEDGVRLMAHVVLDGCTTLGAGCTVFPFASLGTRTQDLKYRGACSAVRIGAGTTVREYVTVNAGTTEDERTCVGARCLLMAYSHVAHGCSVGDEVVMANGATLAGHITVEDRAILGGLTAVHQFVRIGSLCMVGGCSRVTRDCPPFTMIAGNPAAAHGLNRVGLERRGFSAEARAALKAAYRIVYRENLGLAEAVARVRAEVGPDPAVEQFVAFVENSQRGITR